MQQELEKVIQAELDRQAETSTQPGFWCGQPYPNHSVIVDGTLDVSALAQAILKCLKPVSTTYVCEGYGDGPFLQEP